MVAFFLSPPSLYYLLGFILIVSLLIYWKREPIKKELRRWRAKEVTAGPVKFERGNKKAPDSKKSGVQVGAEADFSGTKIKGVAGRDIIRGEEGLSTRKGSVPGVDFGEGNFKNAEIEDIAGRDIVETGDSEGDEKTNTEGNNA